MHKVCLNTGCHREQRLRQHHTRARYVTLPLCTFEHMQHSPRLHSGGSFTCCNRIYVSLRREMREPRRVPSVQTGCRVPLPLIYMCGAPGVRLMPGEMQYDILTHADAEICHCDSAGIRREKIVKARQRRRGVWGRLVYLLRSLLPVRVCSTPHGKCHAGQPEDLRPAPCEISPLPGAIWTPLRGFQPDVSPVFWTRCSLRGSSSYSSSFRPVFLLCAPKCTSFPITSQKEATFEI